jgi:hypothetical protein
VGWDSGSGMWWPEGARGNGDSVVGSVGPELFLLMEVCCAACGRKERLKAGWCALAGWWGPKAAVFNLFVLPGNLIAAAVIRKPTRPSGRFREAVRHF